jgi:hypothetical protein
MAGLREFLPTHAWAALLGLAFLSVVEAVRDRLASPTE